MNHTTHYYSVVELSENLAELQSSHDSGGPFLVILLCRQDERSSRSATFESAVLFKANVCYERKYSFTRGCRQTEEGDSSGRFDFLHLFHKLVDQLTLSN
jgi:hypothetical protein